MSGNPADEILPGLWLGNREASQDTDWLRRKNITVVFNASKDIPFAPGTPHMYRVPVDDNLEDEEIRNMELWSFEAIYKLTKEHKQGNVLVHCYAGMQRSAAVVAMYLIAKYGMKKEQVIPFIKEKRSIAFWPFANFEKSISGFEESYQKDIIPKLMDE
jgi:protein-tyrosine phosphatase